jgi:hypothetical protein
MLRITGVVITCAFCAAAASFGDIEIWAGGGITPPPTINHTLNTIEIEAAGTYGFRAWDGVDTLEAIQNITVDSGVTGNVTVTIAYDAGGGDGATNVWQIDLTGGSGTGALAGLEISGNIATIGDVTCDSITGAIDIGGNLGATGILHTKLSASTVSAAITISGTIVDGDSLDAGTLGDVTIEGVGVNPVQGDIHVTNNYSGTLTINHSFSGDLDCDGNVSGSISITGVTTGLVNVDGNVTGTISLGSNLNVPGRIVVDGNVSQADPNVPAIHVGGGVVGSSASAIPIVIGLELDGVIAQPSRS